MGSRTMTGMIGLILGGGGRYGMITEATLRLIPPPVGEKTEYTGSMDRYEITESAAGPLERITAEIQKVFDPAGILKW